MQKGQPEQHQNSPGIERKMNPKPESQNSEYKASEKFKGKVVVLTGGDSGIGKATAITFSKEGADVAIIYLSADEDAQKTKEQVEGRGSSCLLLKGDIGNKSFCAEAVEKEVTEFGRIDVLINNAGEQHPQEKIEEITEEQLERTFRTNVFGMFFMTQAVMPHLKEGAAIVNTTSITAYEGRKKLIDYSSSKGAVVSFTRALSQSLIEKGIRVNAVAPGPIWTPLIPSTFKPEKVAKFGTNTPMGRAGQPYEVAPCFIFLASDDASNITGQTIYVNGG